MFASLPDKLTPVVKPLMESVRREKDQQLQQLTAKYLSHLLDQCCNRTPCPNEKILVNLCTFLRCDPEFTPVVYHAEPNQVISTLFAHHCTIVVTKMFSLVGFRLVRRHQQTHRRRGYGRWGTTTGLWCSTICNRAQNERCFVGRTVEVGGQEDRLPLTFRWKSCLRRRTRCRRQMWCNEGVSHLLHLTFETLAVSLSYALIFIQIDRNGFYFQEFFFVPQNLWLFRLYKYFEILLIIAHVF